jgi:ABC-type sugar transport system ATPase subunit
VWRSRARFTEATLIILDEPTMGLSLSETRKCLDFVASIKASGKSAIFIDHNIFHVYPVVDRIVVLDRGTIAGQYLKNEVTFDELIDHLNRVAQTSVDGNNHGLEEWATFVETAKSVPSPAAAGTFSNCCASTRFNYHRAHCPVNLGVFPVLFNALFCLRI